MASALPFLMFQGDAAQAVEFYCTVLPDSQLLEIELYGQGETGHAGTVKRASFAVGNQTILCTDSPIKHQFTFTPASSFFVDCDSEKQLRETFAALKDGGGAELMPIDTYGFSHLFGWVCDRFGVSWQLNLP